VQPGFRVGRLAAVFITQYTGGYACSGIPSQSGCLVWSPDDDGEYEWLARQYVSSPRLLLRFYLDAGRYETLAPSPEAPTLLVTNRHMRDVLRAKGYPVHYTEFGGGHNPMNWQGMLADGLLALFRKGKSDN
jgi:enterochelin esterase family protein